MKKLKYIVSVQKGKVPKKMSLTNTGNLPIYLAMDYLRNEPKHISYVPDFGKCVLVDENEILLLWDGSNAGEFMWSKKGVLSSTMAVIKPKTDIHKSFLFYQFKELELYLKDITVGMGIPHVNPQEFLNFSFLIPSFQKQTAIANYLDQKTAEIDQLITQKEQLLELYEEEKTAIINQAVTKGLTGKDGRPSVSTKDSGIDWLGEIPEHWEVKKLSYCFKTIGSGTTPKSSNLGYYNNGIYNWLQTGDLNNNEIYYTSRKITQDALDTYSTLRFYPTESVVIAMYGATIGKTGILKIETTTNQACCVLAKPKGVISKFVFYWFNSVKKHIISMSYGGGQPNINQEMIRFLKLQLPTIKEQTEIVKYIETEISRINTKAKKTKKFIELLGEYKQSLISEVVTGKVKVI